MSPFPADKAQNILPLLDTQLRLAGELEGLLKAEYQALLSSDLATLADLVAQKRVAAELLERSSAELGHCTGGAPQSVIPRLGQPAQQRWQALGDVADSLRKQNLHNGALLNERQNRLRWVAQRASNEAPALYAPQSRTSFASGFAGLSGRSLARA